MNSDIIIGAGVSGVYIAYKLVQLGRENILILEKSDRVGGRLMQDTLGTVNVPLGGGIIRYPKDKHLIHLIENELGLKLNVMPWKQTPSASFKFKHFRNVEEFDSVLMQMKEKVLEETTETTKATTTATTTATMTATMTATKKKPFYQFVNEWFHGDQEAVREFYDLWGFTDMIYTPTIHVIEHYGIEDVMFTNTKQFALIENGHWDALINALITKCKGRVEIRLQENVIEVDRERKRVTTESPFGHKSVYTSSNEIFETIDFNNSRKYSTPWPFMRVYLYSPKDAPFSIPGSIVTNTNLQRVISFGPNVVMASYCDGQNAWYWRDILENQDKLDQFLAEFKTIPGSGSGSGKQLFIKPKFWESGIHFFTPKQYENMKLNLIPSTCLGEWVSKTNQGWVEGAIESIDEYFKF